MTFDARAFLKNLRREVETHPAVNTPSWRESVPVHFPAKITKCSGCSTTHWLECLPTTWNDYWSTPQLDCKMLATKVLVDEYGEGSDGHDHAHMYRMYLTACGVQAEEKIACHCIQQWWISFAPTQKCAVDDPSWSVWAHWGPDMNGPFHVCSFPSSKVNEERGSPKKKFLYFTLHCEQDEDHALWLEEALASMLETPEQAEQVREGTLISLEARRRFWEGVQSEVVAWRQPARPLDLPERARMWLSNHHKWLGRISPQWASRTAVYRPQAHALSYQISIR